MNTQPGVALYELVLEDGRSASPYVWRIRYALAHKGVAFQSRPLGFTDIPGQFGGRFKTVPILEHGDTVLNESWQIAEYLDRAFPQRPLFSSAAENATVRLAEACLDADVLRRMFFIYVLDVHDAARPADRAYFRTSRERYLKATTLEAFTAERASHLPKLRAALAPLRSRLAQHPFLGGTEPNYADYIVLGYFHWVASVATLPLLARDDEVLRAYLERGFDLYGGLGRDARMRPLFE
ncbi:MAG TPA: glutathione S-transferase N-terminal domain-containing protein [Steroidobacteraceae bacterium]|jgi:glutathione S-transferase|nr:glutathione S-transferase N-terminal domain-containing protein [Steroidobacteraceae bacterium]